MKKITTILILICISSKLFSQIPTDSLTAYWPFNGNAIDESGNGHNGIVNGATITADRFNNEGAAYYFDGNDFIETLSTFDFEERSISLWVNPTRTDGVNPYNHVAFTQDGYELEYGLCRLDFDTNVLKLWAGGSDGTYSTENFETNTWHHYVLIRDADSTYYYINNKLVYTSISDDYASTYDPNPQFVIGSGRSTELQFFEGYIDDIRIYKSVLNPEEISYLYYETPCIGSIITDTTFITVVDSISVTDTLIIDVNLDLPENHMTRIKVYPNPTNDIVYISVEDYNEINDYSIEITNEIGTLIYQSYLNEPLFEINLSQFGSNGLYFIKVRDDENQIIHVRKIILY
jgi:hypothetical protein